MSSHGCRAAVVFVESNTSGTGPLFLLRAKDLGFEPVLLTSEPERYDFLQHSDYEVVQTATANAEVVLTACHRLARACGGVAGITSSSEYYVHIAATAARSMGLPGPDPTSVARCRNKAIQRETLLTAGVPIPDWRVCRSERDAWFAAVEMALPVVVKPVDGSGSFGVSLGATLWDTTKAAKRLGALTVNERGLPMSTDFLVERFVEGAEYSVEVFGGRAVGTTAKHLGDPPSFVETGHDFPATLPPQTNEALVDTALAAVRAIGVTWGPTHVEIRLSRDGPRVIEVNPRLAGGWIPQLVLLASGVDLITATISAAVGEEPNLHPTRHRHASIRFVTARCSGRIRRDMPPLPTLPPPITDIALYRDPGCHVSSFGDFRDRIGHAIADSEDASRAAAAAARAAVMLTDLVLDVDQGSPCE